ncbi:MAG: CPBP family intramembrane glutamic endopeptidase [Chlamydiota bacterium]
MDQKPQEPDLPKLYEQLPWPVMDCEDENKTYYLPQIAKKISNATLENFFKPILIGGTLALFGTVPMTVVLSEVLQATGIGDVFASESEMANRKIFLESDQKISGIKELRDGIVPYLTMHGVITPIVEELLHRGVLQAIFNRVGTTIFPDKDVDVFSYKIKQAHLFSIMINSGLFGAVHLTTGIGLQQAIPATGIGIAFGFLKHRLGLIPCISAHMTNNAAIITINALGSPPILHEGTLDVII